MSVFSNEHFFFIDFINFTKGSWKEKIGIQKWIALYDQGFEAWTEYRRSDSPKLLAPENAASETLCRCVPYTLLMSKP